MKLHCFGDNSLPPLLFLHGFLGSSSEWLPFIEALSVRFLCISIDLPGHGEAVLENFNTAMDLYSLSQKLHQILSPVINTPYSILGYSLGGRLALRHALDFPHCINRLILESASPGIDDPKLRQLRTIKDEERAQMIEKEGMKLFLEYWYKMPLFASLQQRPALLEEILAARTMTNSLCAAALIRSASPGREPSMWTALSSLTCPLLLVGGALDLQYVEILTRVAASVPYSTLKLLDEAGHAPHLEVPERFLAVIQEFLDIRNSP